MKDLIFSIIAIVFMAVVLVIATTQALWEVAARRKPVEEPEWTHD